MAVCFGAAGIESFPSKEKEQSVNDNVDVERRYQIALEVLEKQNFGQAIPSLQ